MTDAGILVGCANALPVVIIPATITAASTHVSIVFISDLLCVMVVSWVSQFSGSDCAARRASPDVSEMPEEPGDSVAWVA